MFICNLGLTVVLQLTLFLCREALLSVSKNFFEEIDLGAGDVKVTI